MPLLDDKRIDYRAVHDALRAGRSSEAWLDGWLSSTWNSPARWKAGLYASVAEQRGGAVKGRPSEGLDLYHDCILAHLGKRRVALVVRDDHDLLHVPFETLHERSSALANAWIAAGVAPGECVAIVLPVGLDYAVALVTALRLGLVPAPLPPLGPTYVRSRLARLAADRVVSAGRHQRTLPPGTPLLTLALAQGDASLSASHSFADDEPALRLLSPFAALDAEPTALPAGALHEALLRDSLLVFTLEPGDRLAAPGLDPVQLQPLAMMTAWMAGAAWVELEPRELDADPKVLSKASVTTLGVSRAVREVILRLGPEVMPSSSAWFRSVNESFDHDRWAELSRVLAGRKIAGFSVLTNAASGGAHLFAPRSLDLPPTRVWPAPGRTFQLSQVGGDMLPALGATGVYTPLLEADERDPSLLDMVLARQGDGFTLGGTTAFGPDGATVPVREIAAAAEMHPAVRAAAVVVAPGRWMNDAHVILLLFVEPDPAGTAPAVPLAEITSLVRREMGDVHVPSRIETYAVRPRFVEGEVDLAWCRSQYLSGALTSKTRSPLFAASARLGWIFGVRRSAP